MRSHPDNKTFETDTYLDRPPLFPVASSDQNTSSTEPALKSEGGKEKEEEKSSTVVEQIYRTRA